MRKRQRKGEREKGRKRESVGVLQVCVRVCERETEGERKNERERERGRKYV